MPVEVVAELSANHAGDKQTALSTIESIAETGADYVKIQTYTPDTMTIDCDRPEFTISQGTVWDGRTLYGLYGEAHMPWEWQRELKDAAEARGLQLFSSPFDRSAVDFLEDLNVPMYKIASFEITDIDLISYAAGKGKPLIISTGIANLEDIELAIETCRKAGNEDVTLLQCTSSYPAPVEKANLRMIPDLAHRFGVRTGLSDHSLGSTVAVAAVALGATMVEKHFILDRSLGGPDSEFSMEPQEFSSMVAEIRAAERALGTIDYSMTESKLSSRKFARSLFVVKDLSPGDTLSRENVRSIRPGDGLHPRHLPDVLGQKVVRQVRRGEPLCWDMIG